MAEYADYILNGDDCQVCGQYIGQGDGYPRTCCDCNKGNRKRKKTKKGHKR